MQWKSFAGIAVLAGALSGCAGSVVNMDEMPGANPAPEPGKAMVVFLRPSGVGFVIQSTVFEVQGENESMVGVVAAKSKVAYQVPAGEHLFMVVGESADFMSAGLEAGRTYYAKITPRIGVLKARFSLLPVNSGEAGSAEFEKDLADCKWVATNASTDNWFASNKGSIDSKRTEYYPEWMQKAEGARPRLNPDDGR